MNIMLNQSQKLSYMKEYNEKRISEKEQKPFLLNVKLMSNPFLKDEEMFHFLIYQISQYNKRVLTSTVKDQYESLVYQKMHGMLSDIAQISERNDQISRLQQIYQWFKKEDKLLQQRLDQGNIRYKVDKKSGLQSPIKEMGKSQRSFVGQIPTKQVNRQSLPFRRGWRTTHKQLEMPSIRLQEYKRKIIHISPFSHTDRTEKKAPRIKYPKVEKQEEPEEGQQEEPKIQNQQGGQQQEGLQNKEGQEGQPKPPEDQLQDLGFGEDPQEEEAQQQQPEEVQDKLAPRFKPYTIQRDNILERKRYKEGYLFFNGEESPQQRRMEERYHKREHSFLTKQKSDSVTIDQMHGWAINRSKMEKSLQKRLESMKFKPRYSFSKEEPQKVQRINPNDEKRFGFSMQINPQSPTHKQVDLSGLQLPQIASPNRIEKEIKKDRLNSLKNKFAKLLTLKEYESRETNQSICQYESRRRGFSEILKDHSKQKERLKQLDEAASLKEKLTRTRVGIDMKALTMGLCSPQDEQNLPKEAFPEKSLPKNPFWVQPKKKKKKK